MYDCPKCRVPVKEISKGKYNLVQCPQCNWYMDEMFISAWWAGYNTRKSEFKWISVRDALPENRVGKIVYCEGDGVTTMYYDPNKKYWISQMGFERYDVIAWMDKPNPP